MPYCTCPIRYRPLKVLTMLKLVYIAVLIAIMEGMRAALESIQWIGAYPFFGVCMVIGGFFVGIGFLVDYLRNRSLLQPRQEPPHYQSARKLPRLPDGG